MKLIAVQGKNLRPAEVVYETQTKYRNIIEGIDIEGTSQEMKMVPASIDHEIGMHI